MAGGNEGICADKAAPLRIIVAGLQVVEVGFVGVDIANEPKLGVLTGYAAVSFWRELSGTDIPSPVWFLPVR